jgi:AcrR family transcriptional regulator
MSQSTNQKQWIETGFELFVREGHEGIQIERLARILRKNKSGFYHYFGSMDKYFEALMRYHSQLADQLIADTEAASDFDPGFLLVMVKHKETVMGHMQLIRNRHIKLFADTFTKTSRKIDLALLPLWIKHIEVTDQPEAALRYFEMIRDMFFSRITFETLHYDYLHAMASEAKTIISTLQKSQML